MSYDTSICLFGHFSRFFNLIYEVGAKIGHFGLIDRTHLRSIIPFRQVEICIHQKKSSDLMFKDGDTIPPPHTGLFILNLVTLPSGGHLLSSATA